MNTNRAPAEAVGLVGYLPVLEVSETCRSLPEYKKCTHHILQECIGSVLRLIEKRATHGFTAIIAGEKKTFFPRLGAMTLDTKERVKYFGLRSDRTCGFCRLRLGRSVTRKATRQDEPLHKLLMEWAGENAEDQAQVSQRASQSTGKTKSTWMAIQTKMSFTRIREQLSGRNTSIRTCTVCWSNPFRKDAHF